MELYKDFDGLVEAVAQPRLVRAPRLCRDEINKRLSYNLTLGPPYAHPIHPLTWRVIRVISGRLITALKQGHDQFGILKPLGQIIRHAMRILPPIMLITALIIELNNDPLHQDGFATQDMFKLIFRQRWAIKKLWVRPDPDQCALLAFGHAPPRHM